MDVQRPPRSGGIPQEPTQPSRGGALNSERVGQALGEWQSAELSLARSFGECRGLGHEQLEDLYQETVLVLLGRRFHNEEHLRNALRWGIKHRALHVHRDERRRLEILSERAPELQLAAEGRAEQRTPELAALLEEDRLVVAEFLTELSELERRVFWLAAEGMRYRAIAPVLQIPVNEARKAARSCESKRARFQLLYDTGRLCGYRAHTIQGLKAGRATSEELTLGAYAHLDACAHCRAEHKTNARRLRRSFQSQVAALLPIPVLVGRLGWLAKLDLKARSVHQRLPYGTPPGTSSVRDGAVAILAGGGAAAKLAAGVVTVAVIAGGTIGATQLHPRHAQHHRKTPAGASARNTATAPENPAATPAQAPTPQASATPTTSQARATSRPGAASSTRARREPGGFAFLGVPSASAQQAGEPAHAASAGTRARPARARERDASRVPSSTGGGPFSP